MVVTVTVHYMESQRTETIERKIMDGKINSRVHFITLSITNLLIFTMFSFFAFEKKKSHSLALGSEWSVARWNERAQNGTHTHSNRRRGFNVQRQWKVACQLINFPFSHRNQFISNGRWPSFCVCAPCSRWRPNMIEWLKWKFREMHLRRRGRTTRKRNETKKKEEKRECPEDIVRPKSSLDRHVILAGHKFSVTTSRQWFIDSFRNDVTLRHYSAERIIYDLKE